MAYTTRPGLLCIILMVIIMGMHITGTFIILITVTTVITAITIITEDRCFIGKLKAKA
jgi:hypothetical protein